MFLRHHFQLVFHNNIFFSKIFLRRIFWHTKKQRTTERVWSMNWKRITQGNNKKCMQHLVGITEEKTMFGREKEQMKNNIKMVLEDFRCESLKWIHLIQNMNTATGSSEEDGRSLASTNVVISCLSAPSSSLDVYKRFIFLSSGQSLFNVIENSLWLSLLFTNDN